ncbi:hypothetical protein G6F68_010894 [Rhizopus microsporus]|nr:hypothetical protein G6F68_010894 [Rhizopus microsporus]
MHMKPKPSSQAEGQRRGQQQRGFPGHGRQLEEVLRAGAPIGTAGQHHIGGKQRGEDEAVAHQVHPETEDGVAAGVVVLVVVMAMGRRMRGLRLHQALVFQVLAVFVLDAFHLGGRDPVVHVLVEGAVDERGDHADEADDGQPPDVPDHREAEHQAEGTDDHARAGVARHVDVGVLGRLRPGFTTLLALPEIVQLGDFRQRAEGVEGLRRRGFPLQRTGVPRVAGQVGGLLAVADRHGHLDDLAQDAGADDEGTCSGHQQQRLVGRVDGALQTTGHAHEAQHVHRHEGHNSLRRKPNIFGHQ